VRNVQGLAARLELRLNQNLAPDADAAEVASRIVSLWQHIAAAFSPIVGQRGFTALLRRGLSISLVNAPWFSVALADAQTDDELASLRDALSRQSRTDATNANGALLRNFFDLLASLIGAELTERLLREALDHPSSDIARQEEST
jgi:hypothetical protein